jgi:hypothetical protein
VTYIGVRRAPKTRKNPEITPRDLNEQLENVHTRLLYNKLYPFTDYQVNIKGSA